jgi:hypothetical protein
MPLFVPSSFPYPTYQLLSDFFRRITLDSFAGRRCGGFLYLKLGLALAHYRSDH